MTRFGRILGAIVVAAAIVRIVLYAQLSDYVLVRVPLVDAEENIAWAAQLAAGQPELQDAYYKPPLYPHLLSWAMRLAGARAETALVLNAILGLANVVLLAVWVRTFAGPVLALVAAGIGAIYGPSLYYEVQALPTTLGVTLALGSLNLLATMGREPSGRPWRAMALGVVLGALVLTRPSFLLWAGVAAAWLVWMGRRRQALMALGCVALVLAPVTIVNRVRGQAWVLVSANGGINFFLGNNADWQRTWLLRPGLAWEDLVRNVPEPERQGQARWDRYFARQGMDWMRHHPGDFAAAGVRKALHATSAVELDRNLDPAGFRAQSSVLRWAPRYVCLAPWLALGLVLAWKRARSVVLFWCCGLLTTALVFASERYRMDVLPAVIAAAVLGAAETLDVLRRRATPRRSGVALVLVAAATALALGDWGRLGHANGPHAAALEGVASYREGDLEGAVATLQRAVAEDPFDPEAQYQLGTALQKLGRDDVALRAYEAAAKLVPGNPKPPMAAGWLLRRRGERDAALDRYATAAALDPRNALVHLELAHLLEEMGQTATARTHYDLAFQYATAAEVRAEAKSGLARLQ